MVSKKESFVKDADELLGMWHERGFRDNEYLRARMVCLIAEVGALIRRHAQRMGDEAGHGCIWQVDRFADVMLWQLSEYILQSQIDNDCRADTANSFQMTEAHAADFFDWPPAPEKKQE